MKVLHTIDYYPFYVGKLVYEIAKRLSSNGVVVKVVSSDIRVGSGNYKDDENVVRLKATRIIVGGTPYVIYDLKGLKLFRKQLDVDIIHVHFLYNFLTLYTGFMKKLGKVRLPIVATSHGLTIGYPSIMVQATARLLHELAKRLVIENSSAVTTVSMLEYNFLAKFIPTNKLYYMPNGVDTSLFKPDVGKRRKFRDELGIDDNDILVFYFAHLRAAKGVFIFLQAMNRVIRKTEHVQFIVAGSGPLASHVKKVEGKFGKRIHTFLGYIPDQDLPYYYNGSDVYVLPSYVEGMPLSVMEAMACGKPVIVTSIGDMPILVKNRVNGIVIPPSNADLLADSIIHLAENYEVRNSMGEANVRKMTEYDWKEIAKKYYSLYFDILNA